MKITIFIALALLFGSAFALDESYPTVGVRASSAEISSLNYSCKKIKDDRMDYQKIECDMYYQVLKRGKPIASKSEFADDYKKRGFQPDVCFIFGDRNVTEMTLSEVQTNALKKDEPRNSFNDEVLLKMFPIIQKMCKEKTFESVYKFAEFGQALDAETCEVESVQLKEIFKELPQKKDERSMWLSDGRAVPPCGTKEVIKFMPGRSGQWNIQFEYSVLNKEGKNDSGKMCKDFDGIRNMFNSNNTTWKMPCKYIKVSNARAWNGPFHPQ